MAKRSGELKQNAEIVAISVDPPWESQKLDTLLNKAFPLLEDPKQQVIRAYQMEHEMGAQTTGDMGYVIIDGQGIVREVVSDPLFGKRSGAILESLKLLKSN